MNLERLHEKLVVGTVILVGMLVALYAGIQSGSGGGKWVFFGMVAFALTLVGIQLGRRSWYLIPVCWGLSGWIPALPVPFAARDLVILYVFGIFMALKAVKIVRNKGVIGLPDVILLINLVWLGIAFVRNPVGFFAFEGERVGGKPYFNVAVACMAYWVLARVRLGPVGAQVLPIWMLLGPAVEAITGSIGRFLPSVGERLVVLYSGFALGGSSSSSLGVDLDYGTEFGERRMPFLSALGIALSRTACSFWHPFTCLNPAYLFRLLVFMSAVGLILLSGFRSNLFQLVIFFGVAGWIRSGPRHILKCSVIGIPALALLVAGQGTLYQLPVSAQRSLSFLPGAWDAKAVSDARGSTEWRLEMWKDALTTDVYIRSKWFGDGFGVDRVQFMAVQQAISLRLPLRMEAEAQAIVGGFHSGPVSTIRFVGYIGLAGFYVLLFVMARFAWQQIKRSRNTPYFPLAMIVGIPISVLPLIFTFIFGAYESDLPLAIYNLGLLHLLRNSLDDYLKGPEHSMRGLKSPTKPASRERYQLPQRVQPSHG